MKPTKYSLQELTAASRRWSDKITALQRNAHRLDPSKKRVHQEIIENLKQRQQHLDAYLDQLDSEAHLSWSDKASELERMFNDIDASYREALAYLY